MRPGPARPLVFMLRALLSLLRSFAHVAALSPEPYTRPELVEPTPGADREQSAPPDGGGGEAAEQELLPGCDLVIRRARHPCVELQDGVSFIPNDYTCVFGASRERVECALLFSSLAVSVAPPALCPPQARLPHCLLPYPPAYPYSTLSTCVDPYPATAASGARLLGFW